MRRHHTVDKVWIGNPKPELPDQILEDQRNFLLTRSTPVSSMRKSIAAPMSRGAAPFLKGRDGHVTGFFALGWGDQQGGVKIA